MNKHTVTALKLMLALLPAMSFTVGLRAQDDPNKKIKDLKKQFDTYRQETDEALEDMEDKMNAALQHASSGAGATSDFVVTGFIFGGFVDMERGSSTFNTGLNPIFLWKVNDKIHVESELEFELEDGETAVVLEYAQILYNVNDALTIGVGKFLNPTNFFQERLHPKWINKLPNAPVGFHGANRLQAGSRLGVQARGAVRMGSTRAEYTVFASNGGMVREDNSESAEPGTVNYSNYEDSNNNKAVGGRVGFFPIPELEVGYSYETSRVGMGADSVIHAADLNLVSPVDCLKGTIDVRSQYVWSRVDRMTYTLAKPLTGSLNFNNERSGGYVQVAFRPTGVTSSEFVANLEPVIRYDMINRPQGSLTPVDQHRWTVGLNYWLDASSVLKIAWQTDDKSNPTGTAKDQDTFMMQFGVGF